jgi:hypothetical protein
MLFRPFALITTVTIRTVLRLAIGYNHAVPVVVLFTTLFSITRSLFSTIGIIPGLRLLNRVRTFILSPEALTNITYGLRSILNTTSLNRLQINSIVKALTPLLVNCLKFPKELKKGFTVLKYFLFLSILGPFFKLVLRTSLGFLLTSIGIVWNNSLINTGLLDFAEYILTSFENNLEYKSLDLIK